MWEVGAAVGNDGLARGTLIWVLYRLLDLLGSSCSALGILGIQVLARANAEMQQANERE